jgi:hypothetical protein
MSNLPTFQEDPSPVCYVMIGGEINNTELLTCPMSTENLTDVLLELVFSHTHYTTDGSKQTGY